MSQDQLLSEEEIVQILWKTLASPKRDPFDDDVAWVHVAKSGDHLISKCDMLVSSTDVPKSMDAFQIAMKAVTSCASDFAAKGVTPLYCLVSIALTKKSAKLKFVTDLAKGFKKASDIYGVHILAGDTNASHSEIIIDCSMFGFADRFVRRRGAKAGDLVGVSGPFGLQAAGLSILQGKTWTLDHSFRRKAADTVLKPRARLDISKKISRHLTSAIDSSDGLAISLYHLAEASRVDIEIDLVPIAKGVEDFAKENSLNPVNLGLFGGEEYEIVCTYPKSKEKKLIESGMITLGKVTKKSSTPKAFLEGKVIQRKGWMHFVS